MRERYSPARVSALLLAALIVGFSSARADWHNHRRDLMGTRVSIDLFHPNRVKADECANLAFGEFSRIESLMSSYISSSELSFINNNAAIAVVEISDEMAQMIEKSLFFSEISAGAFDITYASIGYEYDYRQRKRPSESTIARDLTAIDYRHIELDGNRLRFRDSRVKINLGGIAKGYAVDRATDIVEACGINRAMISAGGDSRILGDRGGRPWIIGVQHPRDPAGIALRLPLTDSAISTSGDYERFFIDEGERVHHIINPETGRSATASWSATVTGADALTTDALSTTIFILGFVDGLALIESLDGIEAILIDNQGKLHYSSGFVPPENEG